jgi:hypothetical protein
MNKLDSGIELGDSEECIMECTQHQVNAHSVETIKQTNKSEKVNNCFYPNLDQIKGKFNSDITKDNLYAEFGNPYIVCLKDSATYKSYFYNQIITPTQMEQMFKSIEVIPTTYKTLTGSAFKYLTTINADIFNKSLSVTDKYGNEIVAGKDVLVCCLLRFNKSNITRYLKQFDGISSFIDLYNGLLINEYLGQTNKTSTIRQNHVQIINNMVESNYYTVHNNCQLNITLKFKSRGFNLALSERLCDKTVQNVLKRLAESKEEDNNYLAFLFRKSSYLDASSAVNASGYKLYRITNNPIVDKMENEHFNALYSKLSHTEKYHMIFNAMISKDLCHFIVNNKFILDEIMSDQKDKQGNTFMNKYAQLLRYTLGYAWLTMYMEESIKRGYIKKSDRFIFDIETASKLPYYPYSINNLHICPYLPILVDSETINADKNVLGVSQYIYSKYNGDNLIKQLKYGVTNKQTFIERVNMFVSGKQNTNILDGLNWSNIAMSGSMMACCLPNYNTLMGNFIRGSNLKENSIDFIAYANEYYKDADIDVMCNIQNVHEFVDKIYEFQKTIEKNIRSLNNIPEETPNVTTMFSNKSAAIMINKYFIKAHLQKDTDMEYVDILSNVNAPKIREAVYKHYINWYKDYLKNAAKENPDKFYDDKYHELYLPVPIENINVVFIKTQKDKEEDKAEEQKKLEEEKKMSDIANDIDIEEDDKDFEAEKQYEDDIAGELQAEYAANNVVFEPKTNFKFRISSFYLPHNFELFQIKHTEFFSTVARFHLPIVRSYYDGSEVFLTPSCISACMTMLNIDYKYFAGSKDPIEIINKYRMRGFGTILNDREIVRLLEYSNLVPKWKQLYSLNIQSNSSVMKILGQLEPSHSIFKPSYILDKKEPSNEYKNHRNLDFNSIPQQTNEIIKMISSMYSAPEISSINLNNITTINKYGYVEPVRKWLIDAFHDYNFNQIPKLNK